MRPASLREVSRSTTDPRSPTGDDGFFRAEALLEYQQGRGGDGRLLRVSPRWTHWTYWLLLVLLLCAITYLIAGRVTEYASGPAIVRMTGSTEMTALHPGTVEAVHVFPGQNVQEGEVLVRFHAGEERNELERVLIEFELSLVQLLRDPSDQGARRALAGIRPRKALAEARLRDRTILAPHAGRVSDVRIRPGQHLNSGEPILTLVPPDRRLSLVALVPGRYRPLMEPGMSLRLEITGFSHAYQDLVVHQVGDEVIGPAAVRRFLGSEVGDAVLLDGPVVVVRAHLPQAIFRADGREHEYYPGMLGRAEVPVRRESLLVTLVPGLKSIVGRIHG